MTNLFAWAEDYLETVDSLWNEGNYKDGFSILMKILEHEPGFAKAHAYVAWYMHYRERNRKLAKMHYEFALRFNPKWGYTYTHYGEFLVEDANEERMRILLKEGLKYGDVNKADLYNDFGRILEMKEKYEEASENYKAALKYTMNYYTMNTIKANRKRVRSKYHLFKAWYSFFL